MHRRISEPYSPRQGNKKRVDGTKNDKHHQMFADNKSQQDDTQDSEPCCTYWQNSNFALAHFLLLSCQNVNTPPSMPLTVKSCKQEKTLVFLEPNSGSSAEKDFPQHINHL